MSENITKIYESQILSIDEKNHTVRVTFTDDQEDRDGDIMDGDSWNFDDWIKAPSILWAHDQHTVGAVLAKGLEIRKNIVNRDGKSVIEHDVLQQFDIDDPDAARVWGKIVRGFIKTMSVGFVGGRREGKRIFDNLLTEISWTPVPSNINALVKSLKDGSLKAGDAKYLRDQANRTVISIDKFLNANEGDIEMTDEEITKLAKGIVDGVTEANKPLVEKMSAILANQEETAKQQKENAKEAETNSDSKKDEGNKAPEAVSQEELDFVNAELDALVETQGESKEEENKEDNSEEE